jgi:TRAP transporter TAXI family solute receptor
LPRRFGDYELLSVLGRGGMGVVYKARQVNLDRLVAVKMILDSRLASKGDVQRFYIEAQAAGRLSHPNLVTIHEVGEIDGQHFYSMDYIDGVSLASLVRDGPLDAECAARYLRTMAEAIHFAHEHGILHRDLKVGNVLIDNEDKPHITDFGLAKLIGDDSSLTAPGAAVGTPSFMSPEQATGNHAKVNRASDVYSLGAILYVLLTGRAPFRKDTVVETMFDVIHTDPTPPRTVNPKADRDLETICLKCLKKKPGRRYRTAGKLAEDLDRFLRGEPILAKPVGAATKCLRWTRNIPMIAAVTGGKSVEPSMGQRRANGAIMLVAILLVVAFTLQHLIPDMLPRRVRLASAARAGVYHEFCEVYGERLQDSIARPTEVLETEGSVANASLLIARESEAALLQENAITSDEIAVVAPLYFEVVYVVARKGRGISRLADLVGKNVSLGPKGSGMRLSARRILSVSGKVDPDELGKTDVYFTSLRHDQELDAALITIGTSNPDVKELLACGDFELLPFDEELIERLSLEPSGFRPYTIHRGSLHPGGDGQTALPEENVHTLATITFLAVRRDAVRPLVTAMLETLYQDSGLIERFDLLTAEESARWRGVPLHAAAHEFFEELKVEGANRGFIP